MFRREIVDHAPCGRGRGIGVPLSIVDLTEDSKMTLLSLLLYLFPNCYPYATL